MFAFARNVCFGFFTTDSDNSYFVEALAAYLLTPKKSRTRRRTRGKTSPLWKFLVPLKDGRKKCRFCEKIFEKSTSLCAGARHFQIDHHRPTGTTPPRGSTNLPPATSAVVVFNAENQEEFDRHLIDWIVDDEQSFSVTANPRFKKLIRM